MLGPARVTTVKPLGIRRVRSSGKRIAGAFGTSRGLKKARVGIVCVSVREGLRSERWRVRVEIEDGG